VEARSAAIDAAVRPLPANGIEIDMADRTRLCQQSPRILHVSRGSRDSLPTRLEHSVVNDAETPETAEGRARRALVS
jgi:hypothetical protein